MTDMLAILSNSEQGDDMGSTTLDISEARRQFNSLDRLLTSEKVIRITRHNREAFAVVDLEYLGALLETLEIMSDPKSYTMFMQSLDDIKNGRVYDQEDLEEEFG